MTPVNIAILYPCSFPNIPTHPALNHMQLMTEVARHPLVETYAFHSDQAVPLDHCRNRLIHMALQNQMLDYVWFLDVDQYYSGEMLTKLLDADKDMIGPLTFTRGKGPKRHAPIAQLDSEEGFQPVDVFTPMGDISIKDYPMPCDIIGFGGLLIHADVLRNMSYPWVQYDRSQLDIWDGISEDVYFCRKARAAGAEIFVHCGTVSEHEDRLRIDQNPWANHQAGRMSGKVRSLPKTTASDDYTNYGEEFYEHPQNKNWAEDMGLWSLMCSIFVETCDQVYGDRSWTDKTFLDFGSGRGSFFSALHNYMGEKRNHQTNYDPSPYAQENFGAVKWEHLGPDYEIIFCSEVLEHCTDDDDARKTIAQIESRSPALVVCTINTKEGQEHFPTHFCLHGRGWWLDLFGEFPDLRYDKERSDIAMGMDPRRLQWFIFTKAP